MTRDKTLYILAHNLNHTRTRAHAIIITITYNHTQSHTITHNHTHNLNHTHSTQFSFFYDAVFNCSDPDQCSYTWQLFNETNNAGILLI